MKKFMRSDHLSKHMKIHEKGGVLENGMIIKAHSGDDSNTTFSDGYDISI